MGRHSAPEPVRAPRPAAPVLDSQTTILLSILLGVILAAFVAGFLREAPNPASLRAMPAFLAPPPPEPAPPLISNPAPEGKLPREYTVRDLAAAEPIESVIIDASAGDRVRPHVAAGRHARAVDAPRPEDPRHHYPVRPRHPQPGNHAGGHGPGSPGGQPHPPHPGAGHGHGPGTGVGHGERGHRPVPATRGRAKAHEGPRESEHERPVVHRVSAGDQGSRRGSSD